MRGLQILIKKSPYELLQGIGLDKKQIQRVTLAIGNAVKTSMTERNEKDLGEKERERRVDYCFRQSLRFICDYDFTVKEVERYLSDALRCFLIGLVYQPSDRLLANRNAIGE